ncbi:MAG: phosphoribosyl-ATP diphosphatase, partial [Acutalibacteraceae bacterium]|nr:phosphoribosyl-ATP diphosphatase [Acutalibacteraceae bacterium]
MSNDVLQALYQTVIERKENPQEGSYTCYLLDKGLDKILKKVGEE